MRILADDKSRKQHRQKQFTPERQIYLNATVVMKKNRYAKRIPTCQSWKKFFWNVLVFLCEAAWVTGTQRSDGERLSHLDGDSALPENVNGFPKASLLSLLVFLPFGKIRPMQQQCLDYTVTIHYEEVSELTIFVCFFTGGKRESQKMSSTAIRQLGSPSPASGRLCPPFPDKEELHWWPLHELRLCRPQRRRWLVSRSTSSSPAQSNRNTS